ncbi:retrovirus-related pol polyprotein from transposon TNT 1-94, partial [Tanacetum coccineum]
KDQLQEKDTVIRKLKDRIKSFSGKDSVENVEKNINEIEKINIELEHSVTKLLFEYENLRKEGVHLKSIYKDQFESIRKICIQSKEQSLKNELRKLKGKNVVDTPVSKPSTTITPGMLKLDIEPISHRLKINRVAHEVYLKKTIENTDTLCGLVECARKQNPSEPLLESACMSKTTTSVSRSKPLGNTKNNRILRPPSRNQNNKLEEYPRKVKSSLNKMNSVSEHNSNALVKHSMRNAKFEYICAIYNKCLFDANHDMCIIDYVNDVNVRAKSESKRNKTRKVWKPTGKVFNEIGYSWKPTCRTFTIVGNSRRPKATRFVGSSSKVKIVESKTSNFKEPKQSWGYIVSDLPSSSLNDRRFENDHIAKIMGYEDYQMGNVTISRVYYVKVAFCKHTCFIRDLDGVDLLKGSSGSNLYTLSMDNLLLSSPICLLFMASKTKSWLWHRRLSHLNFDYITSLAKHGLVPGLPKLKYQKDHLCSVCALSKSKKHSHKPKAEDSIQEKLYLLHMDLYGPMRIQRKYMVIVDDYSRFTWVKFLRSKDGVP